jgi:hypothetical protein
MLSSLFTAFSLLFGHLCKQVFSGVAVWTSVWTCVPYDCCLLRCSDTSSNTGGRLDASSGRPGGHNGNRLCWVVSASESSLTSRNCLFLIFVTLNLSISFLSLLSRLFKGVYCVRFCFIYDFCLGFFRVCHCVRFWCVLFLFILGFRFFILGWF